MYGIPTLPVDQHGRVVPGPPVVGYVGKSVQTVKQREGQHRAEQPFGDLICGGSWVIEEGFWTEGELDARERHYIRHGAVLIPGQRAQRPVYNHDWNLDNPVRIEKWRAVEQREMREPGWQPLPGGVVRVQARFPRRLPAATAGRWRWTRRRIRAALFAAVWLALCAGFWLAGGDVWHGWDAPRNAAAGASVVSAAVLSARAYLGRPRRRRRTVRRRR